MANVKRNKAVARWAIALGTMAACLGIWTVVVKSQQATASSATTTVMATQASPAANANFSATDTFLSQPVPQTVQEQSSTVQQQTVQRSRFRTRAS